MKRMWHPTLDSFVDVDDKAVEEWAEAGWRKSAPKHATEPDFAPGEHPGVARVPVLEDVSSTTTGTGATGTGTRGGGRSAATSSTATGNSPSA